MKREDAIKKLSKMLGKSLGYRVDPKAPTAEERTEAAETARVLNAEFKIAEEAEAARRKAILEGDAEYQRLRAETKRLRDAKDRAWSTTRHFKITVGRSRGIFFSVEAEGDSWEEVIEKLSKERVAA